MEAHGRSLSPRLDREEVVAFFRKRGRLSLFRPRIGRLELVYLPVYVVEATIRHAKTESPRAVLFAVDAIGGAVRRLDHRVDLSSSDDRPAGESFPGRLGEREALERARREIPWLVLPFALRRNRTLAVEGLRVVEGVGYPYWIQYLIRRRGYDFQVLDGFSGSRVGARGRSAILAAILRQDPDG